MDFSKLQVTRDETIESPDYDVNAVKQFGLYNAPYMLEVDWDSEEGWHAPEIKPRHALALDPSCTVLHYAISCFEGMKAYKDKDGRVLMFRPELNLARMNNSSQRLGLPTFDVDTVLKLMDKLNVMNANFVPSSTGSSLYLRPTMISTHDRLGLAMPQKAKFFVIGCPSGPYFANGFNPVTLTVEEEHVRAVPGGLGCYKAAANYAGPIQPTAAACKRDGVNQVVWTYADDGDRRVCEAGSMNFFALVKEDDGLRLYTPELDGTILPGITRRSAIEYCRDNNLVTVEERPIYMRDIVKWSHEGRLVEMFGVGTAVVVCPIRSMKYRGEVLEAAKSEGDTFCKKLFEGITQIQYHKVDHEWQHFSN